MLSKSVVVLLLSLANKTNGNNYVIPSASGPVGGSEYGSSAQFAQGGGYENSGGYGQNEYSGYGQGGFGQNSYAQSGGYGQNAGYAQNNGYSQNAGYYHNAGYSQNNGYYSGHSGGGGGYDSYSPSYNTIPYSSGPSGPGSYQPSGPSSGYGNQIDASYSKYGYNGYAPHGRIPAPYPDPYRPRPPVPTSPRDSLSIAKLFPFKIGLFAFAKLLLKILFFKKIVKFIAILILLLFIPVLTSNLPTGFTSVPFFPGTSFDQGSFRSLQSNKTDEERMLDLRTFVKISVNAFREKMKKCPKDQNQVKFICHMNNVLDAIDSYYTRSKISKLFPFLQIQPKTPVVPKEEALQKIKDTKQKSKKPR